MAFSDPSGVYTVLSLLFFLFSRKHFLHNMMWGVCRLGTYYPIMVGAVPWTHICIPRVNLLTRGRIAIMCACVSHRAFYFFYSARFWIFFFLLPYTHLPPTQYFITVLRLILWYDVPSEYPIITDHDLDDIYLHHLHHLHRSCVHTSFWSWTRT